MSAKDGGGARLSASCCLYARPHRLFPARVLGVTPGLPPPPPPPPAPSAPAAERPAHPSRKQNGGGASPYPTRREPFSTSWRGRHATENAIPLRRKGTPQGTAGSPLSFCLSAALLPFLKVLCSRKRGRRCLPSRQGSPQGVGKSGLSL